jgi:hypothetical protein
VPGDELGNAVAAFAGTPRALDDKEVELAFDIAEGEISSHRPVLL